MIPLLDAIGLAILATVTPCRTEDSHICHTDTAIVLFTEDIADNDSAPSIELVLSAQIVTEIPPPADTTHTPTSPEESDYETDRPTFPLTDVAPSTIPRFQLKEVSS